MDYIKKIYEYVLNLEHEHSHDFGHILRVTKNAEIIAENENANKEIVIISALLHDIARADELKGLIEDHAIEGALRAERFLKEINYPYVNEVKYCIEVHRFSKGLIPETLEAKILQDADRLDALGNIGIARVFMHKNGGDMKERLNHFYEKILKLGDLMHTKTAKKMAEEKNKIIKNFVEGLERELNLIFKI
ncbi:hypothetical protein XO10_00135 [Marinitoga sp. 1135]|uniref:HD domain-containing protein n=1 Tax=Marinitoga sp. 1135 TaxID=1643333 RepID=UPI001586AF76|nr:HD domain-containing protein [Marinitoga sp. 1135]NUU94741.1 hypothetical protein [Marinitoga sp. 1135]